MTTQTELLSIKEAADKYQKAEITIRRFVRSVVESKNKEERAGIHPPPKEVKELKKKSKHFTYHISNDLLEKKFGEKAQSKSSAKKKSASKKEDGEYADLLQKMNAGLMDQMKVKDEQIRALNQSLDEMTARQRETNIIMKGFQEQFLLQSGSGEEKKRWWKPWRR